MADVRPLRGLRYNSQVAGDLSKLICPPYDIINDAGEHALKALSPFNAVCVELPEARPADTPQDNRYTRSGATLRDWQAKGGLVRDAQPVYYLARQRFTYKGTPTDRLGFTAAVRLEEFEKGIVLPHEYTRSAAKEDRLALIKTVRTNISPIMALFRDTTGAVLKALVQTTATPPLAAAQTAEERVDLWTITDKARQSAIAKALEKQPLYLADGHHRYETAVNYRNYMREQLGGKVTGNEAWNFVMITLISIDDPGLIVQPYLRMLNGLSPDEVRRVEDALKGAFAYEPLPGGRGDGWVRRLQETLETRGKTSQVLGVVGPGNAGPHVLTQKAPPDVAKHGPMARFEAWALEELSLRPALGDVLGQRLSHIHDADEAAHAVTGGTAQMAIFVKAIPLPLFEEIVRLGHRLPAKSTYFWPKLPTGLVFNPVEGDL